MAEQNSGHTAKVNAETGQGKAAEQSPGQTREQRQQNRQEQHQKQQAQLYRRLLIGAATVLSVVVMTTVVIFVLAQRGTSVLDTDTTLTVAYSEGAAQPQPAEPEVDYAALFESPNPYERLRYESSFGFELIGAGAEQALSPTAREEVMTALNSIEGSGHRVGFVMYDLTTGLGLAYNSNAEFYGASSIKGIYVASLVSEQPEAFAANAGIMESILAYSSNDAYEALYGQYGSKYLKNWYLKSDTELTYWNPMYPYLSARDMARLWVSNQRFFTSGAPYAAELAELYTHPNNSVINAQLGWLYPTYTKAGWWYSGAENAGESTAGGTNTAEPGSGQAGQAGASGEQSGPAAAEVSLLVDPSASDAGIVVAGQAGSRPYILVILSDYQANLNALSALTLSLNTAHDDFAAVDLGQLYRIEHGLADS